MEAGWHTSYAASGVCEAQLPAAGAGTGLSRRCLGLREIDKSAALGYLIVGWDAGVVHRSLD